VDVGNRVDGSGGTQTIGLVFILRLLDEGLTRVGLILGFGGIVEMEGAANNF
jgi:hypothetical protein